MSFGLRAARRPASEAPCPCGGGAFRACCGAVLAGAPAATARALMRSRFTAFALGDAAYLLQTWHPRTSPGHLDLDDILRWERLEIVRAEAGGAGEEHGVVEFRAHWRDTGSGSGGVLHEASRFTRASGRWFYLDGVVSPRG